MMKVIMKITSLNKGNKLKYYIMKLKNIFNSWM